VVDGLKVLDPEWPIKEEKRTKVGTGVEWLGQEPKANIKGRKATTRFLFAVFSKCPQFLVFPLGSPETGLF
jgi:hypothetical protein